MTKLYQEITQRGTTTGDILQWEYSETTLRRYVKRGWVRMCGLYPVLTTKGYLNAV